MPILINLKDVITFILGKLSPIFWNASVLRIVMAFLFRVLRKTDQKTAKNGLEWRMDEVMGIVCGAMFGEERVNNSVDVLSFSVGQISALVTVTHFYCNVLLQMLECYWTCSHARLACFLFETNQHFVGSARIAGLCFIIAVQHSYQLSYQASLELLVFVWIQTYSQERQTKVMCMYSFSFWEFMLQI